MRRYALLLAVVSACSGSPTAPGDSFREIGSGTFSGFTEQQVVAVRDEATWVKVREQLVFGSGAAPPIDFAADTLVLVALGQRPTGGYTVRVESVARRGGVLEISAVEQAPGGSCVTIQALTQPFQVIAVTRTDQSVNAAWSRITRNCT